MSKPADDPNKITFNPALREIGTARCPICKHKVIVFLTKTNRPFVNCGNCSARIFYNGRESIARLTAKMQPIREVRQS